MKNFRDHKREDKPIPGLFSNNFGGSSRYGSPREVHKAVCADCGNECDVPFKPKEGRPVYCRSCFGKHKPKQF